MPDVTFFVHDLSGSEDAEKLERALTRLSFVGLANVNTDKGLVAVSYEGGAAEMERLEQALEESGHSFEPSPGARQAED